MCRTSSLNGLFSIYKPEGYYSADIVRHVRNIFKVFDEQDLYLKQTIMGVGRGERKLEKVSPLPTISDIVTLSENHQNKENERSSGIPKKREDKQDSVKVGHGGTLDPLAKGILVIGVGSGTKVLGSLLNGDQCLKTYIAEGKFGSCTTTYDSMGDVVDVKSCSHITRGMIESVLKKNFKGEVKQNPPAVSAIRVNGKRMYDIVREAAEGKSVIVPELTSRTVFIDTIHLLEFNLSKESGETCITFKISVTCGGGTYIRSIIHDLGILMDSFAHMTSLERTHQGIFTLENSIPLENLSDYEFLKSKLIDVQKFNSSIKARKRKYEE
jgi:tRNA pseudouridine55 synthase